MRTRKIPSKDSNSGENQGEDKEEGQGKITPDIKIDDKGVSYVFPDAPFVYQYSYTETPKMKPLAVREPPVAPFEPATMGRPWTGRKPLPPSKKKMPEFDSFQLPPPHKKGIKPVQAPGPFLPGSGPQHVKSREEILGEPLTKEEVDEMVESCRKSARQLNIGRDGLTHNMLDNIHAHWKRRRVCKIKCKGVCTVDMDNVRQQLEEKTGGQVILSRGGVIFLFRGRNYNYKSRPRHPLMLWKPATPVYPRLVKRVPEGLTLEEASELRKKGRTLTPICKLGKNGVYCGLVKHVREAFEECELVRINCQGMNGSDYRKIGAKLKDLVPCVLISFEGEHILIWRGHEWKSSLLGLTSDANGVGEIEDISGSSGPNLEDQGAPLSESISSASDELANDITESHSLVSSTLAKDEESEESMKQGEEIVDEVPSSSSSGSVSLLDVYLTERTPSQVSSLADSNSFMVTDVKTESNGPFCNEKNLPSLSFLSESEPGCLMGSDNHAALAPAASLPFDIVNVSEDTLSVSNLMSTISPSTRGVHLLRQQAIESGSAVVFEGLTLDADSVYQKAVDLSKTAPPGPVYRHGSKKVESQEMQQSEDLKVKAAEKAPEKEVTDLSATKNSGPKVPPVASSRGIKKSSKRRTMKEIREEYLNIAPRGTLQVDELAKLLS